MDYVFVYLLFFPLSYSCNSILTSGKAIFCPLIFIASLQNICILIKKEEKWQHDNVTNSNLLKDFVFVCLLLNLPLAPIYASVHDPYQTSGW